mmetsp:Transcript_3517/g.8278  ORF Transcript_3517/g.8278 Transcript_3517/m.8278 type:complete len:154 (+) Transcript_3517:55-516(+)
MAKLWRRSAGTEDWTEDEMYHTSKVFLKALNGGILRDPFANSLEQLRVQKTQVCLQWGLHQVVKHHLERGGVVVTDKNGSGLIVFGYFETGNPLARLPVVRTSPTYQCKKLPTLCECINEGLTQNTGYALWGKNCGDYAGTQVDPFLSRRLRD